VPAPPNTAPDWPRSAVTCFAPIERPGAPCQLRATPICANLGDRVKQGQVAQRGDDGIHSEAGL
jgi:hypothetical protein